ncbi:TetR/AcrR family transcriptional regulator [Nocardia alni]|uniref:TetR/AcrR family transcriptional regulator n=1 Tax=Nocardia alni TaxID=2815723 RepID=UPI001C2249D2|nr:TetR/AcrR family transcriptional regulator [Nocardia alni]
MPRITAQTRQARRERIIAATIELFSERGYEGMSISDVIEASGSSAGMIYSQFRSKAGLVSSALFELFAIRADELEESGPGHRPAQLVREFLAGDVYGQARSRLLIQLWAAAGLEPELGELADNISTGITAVFRRQIGIWYTQNGIPDADTKAEAEATVCLGICIGYIVQSGLNPDFDGKKYLDTASRMMMRDA